MQYMIRITDTFLVIIGGILGDARAYAAGENPGGDETLDGLVEVDRQFSATAKSVRGEWAATFDEVALDALRAEAEFRVEWARDLASDAYESDRMRWMAWARSAQSMVDRIDKVRAAAA